MSAPIDDNTASLASRIKGSIYGVAVADALGSPVECQPRGTFPLVTEMLENETFNVPTGSFTDDTSLTLCLATSIAANNLAFKPIDQIRRYIRWHKDGYMSSTGDCFDIGASTRIALDSWDEVITDLSEQEKDTSLGQRPSGEERKDEEILEEGNRRVNKLLNRKTFSGNGSLMRAAPIALAYFRPRHHPHLAPHADLFSLAISHAASASALTHPYPSATEACQLYTALMLNAMEGKSKAELAGHLSNYLLHGGKEAESANPTAESGLEKVRKHQLKIEDKDLRDRLMKYCIEHGDDSINMHAKAQAAEDLNVAALAKWQAQSIDNIKSSGYVVSTLEAALWSFFTTETFEDGAVEAVNLGYDADTVGAVYGGLAGVYYGFEQIPERWARALQKRDLVDKVTEDLIRTVCKD